MENSGISGPPRDSVDQHVDDQNENPKLAKDGDHYQEDNQYRVDPGAQLYDKDADIKTLPSLNDETLTTHGDDQYSSIPDILQLNYLCANAKSSPTNRSNTEEARLEADELWEPVREWFKTHAYEEVYNAATQRGESSMTALHFACQNNAPIDIIRLFVDFAVETVQWSDAFGWLPLHYACACSADDAVVKALEESFPETKTAVDRRGCTPLHLIIGNPSLDQLAFPALVALLSSTGAASFADHNGMLPLHLACAFGASEEALYVLTDAHREAISARDNNERTPLHFALSNAARNPSPGAVRHLLNLDNKLANANNTSPLRVLAEFAQRLRKSAIETEFKNVQKCLELLLNADPEPTADFFTVLQSLPDWLSEQAVVMPNVQVLLNEKISQRFPTAVLLLDFYFLAMIIISYSINVIASVKLRFTENQPDNISALSLSPLYVGAGYFLIREVIQIISLLSLKSFRTWVYDPSNWLNVAFIFLVLYWTIQMNTGGGDAFTFRTGAALTVTILWLKVLAFLRNMLIDFAVFAGGVFYVLQRLVAFLISLGIILVGYAQMFVTLFQQTSYCDGSDYPKDLKDISCGEDSDYPFCNFWDSFINVYTMLVGEVKETDFKDSHFATFLFITFMFLVVILLANVLIAIVTDSYKFIQDKRAAIVFWTNRLDFVAEMDAIASGPWKKRVRGMLAADEHEEHHHVKAIFGMELWKQLLDLFEDDNDHNMFTMGFWAYTFLRVLTAIFIIPMWIVLGVLSAGWLWPPQVREYIFTSTVSKHSSQSERDAELRRNQVDLVQKEVMSLKDAMVHELKIDRTRVVQMKLGIAERRTEIARELKQIKGIVTLLFQQQPVGV